MKRMTMNRLGWACLSTLVLTAIALPAAAQTLYRYVDANGRVVYSDQPPPPSAKEVQPKRLPENIIETDPVPFAAREAAEKYPVTLYTFDCEICKQAEALLAKRGVPFTTVIVSEEEGAAKLMALTGKQSAPVLQVGEKQVLTGFNATRWQAMLDDAGYPKTLPAQPRQTAARTSRANTGTAAGAPQPPADASPPAAAGPGTDYPN
jgi:glutaredoxin